MDFQKLLLEVGKSLGQDELKALAFLCMDLLRRNPNSVDSFPDLFSSLMDKDVLSAEKPQLLTELLTIIRQPRLLRDLHLSAQITSNYISAYRKLLYSLSEDITDEDLRSMKFLLNSKVPRRKLAENTTLDVFLEMEHLDLINETNLNKLEEIFNSVCPVLNLKIDQYKAEMGRPRSLSLPSESNEVPASFQRTGSLGRGVQPMPPSFLPSMNSSNSSDDVGQVGVICQPLPTNNVSYGLNKMETQGATMTEAQKQMEGLETYPMTAAKRGICVILNNNDFSKSDVSLKDRVGTDVDEQSLKRVFEWLNFEVQIHRDLVKETMLSVLKMLGKGDHSQMDCLVCCVLSHGKEGIVYGVDGCTVTIKELMDPFDGLGCVSLVEKPKLFFIQACQGNKEQKPVEIDGREEEDDDDYICSDARVTESIPNGADFLLGMATVPSYVSFRDRTNGTWYIQSLCQNLIQMVPREVDLVSILTKVNADVSRKSCPYGWKKQMPQPAFSLRKKVIFPVPKMPPPDA
ncbi:caspase-8 [Nematolebias whitei]|uniref:caspase-8 n=1 Tax=Nematolebias whitei TaxID=451745 RepID=UPI0018989369|nr:caspase-8 [Nematolebias whitei]